MEPCEGAQILARVGNQVILASEVMAGVNAAIERYKDQVSPDELQQARRLLIQRALQPQIETSLIYHDARQKLPDEQLKHVEKRIGEEFDEKQIQKMMESMKTQTREQLDARLGALGSSLQRRKRAFIRGTLARTWMRQQINFDEEVTHQQMLGYYRDHIAEFEHPARARWEELVVRFSDHPNQEAAHTAVASMGNQVFAGAPFAEVARRFSGGTTAAEGGRRDWTTQGNLVSEVLDEALFGPRLQVGQLSPILQSKKGFHIVRIVQREAAHVTPFLEAQAEIKPKIQQQRTKEQLQTYVAKLQETIPVWTVFDKPSSGERVSSRSGYPAR